MKKIQFCCALICAFCTLQPEAYAFVQATDTVAKDSVACSGRTISSALTGGIKVEKCPKEPRKLTFTYFNMDFGLNFLVDNTNYQSAEASSFLNVPDAYKNESLFSLAQMNSWNYNLWPVTMRYTFLDNTSNALSLKVSAGIQVYNFKFNKPVQYRNITQPEVVLREDVPLTKNKLSVMYGSIPLMLNYTAKLAPKTHVNIGFGVIGGMNLSTWTKQRSAEYGKQKDRDMFNLQRWQNSLVFELGLVEYFTLYATYQLTDMHKYGLSQRPFSVGLRF